MNNKVIENEIKWHTEHVVGSTEPFKILDVELNRYRFCRDWKFNPKQRLFKEMGNLAGKQVLDFGSGQGHNGVEMALLGANVCGFDVVPGLVEESTRLAQLNEVEDRCRFYVAEASSNELGENKYEIVLIDNVLHHIPREDHAEILGRIKKATKIGGKIIIREPVELVGIFSKIKKTFSVGVPITPDERELGRHDLDVIVSTLGNCDFAYFGLLARLVKFSGSRFFLDLSLKIDQTIFELFPFLRRYAATVTIASRKITEPAISSVAVTQEASN